VEEFYPTISKYKVESVWFKDTLGKVYSTCNQNGVNKLFSTDYRDKGSKNG